jgi:hypothetical protein
MKISPPPGFDPLTVQPVFSRYTDYATRPTWLLEGVIEIFRVWWILQTVTTGRQTANVAYFQNKIQLSEFSAYPAGSSS